MKRPWAAVRASTAPLFSFFVVALAASVLTACGSNSEASGTFDLPDASADATVRSDGSDTTLPPSTFGDASAPDAAVVLTVAPLTGLSRVEATDGVVTSTTPVAFQAFASGMPVKARWSLDRGELGTIDSATGVFTPSGNASGEGVVTARYGSRDATAKVIVALALKQNGGGAIADAGAGAGGLGGVGGEPLGGAVPAPIGTRFGTESHPPTTAGELTWLYPYDKTVFPRGLLPPLLQWRTTHAATAVYVKLSQQNFTFEGTYDLTGRPLVQQARVRLDDVAWSRATRGNGGDALHIEVKIYSQADDKIYGPIARDVLVAPGVLKGTVYYNSYNSKLTGGAAGTRGGVIAIKPGSPEPTLALPTMAGKCHVCHTMSSDGSTLFVQDGKADFVSANANDDYRNGASYDLRSGGAVIARYDVNGPAGTAANNRKFLWSAPYPDGSFALASSGYTREAYLESGSKLFRRSDGAEIATAGFSNVVDRAVTPAFSPDGRKVVFNFWTGAGGNGVTPGGGRSLAIVDFDCGAAAGTTACTATPPYTFGGPREIYRDGARYPAWPAFLPDGKAVVFHNTLKRGDCGDDPPKPNSNDNCQLTTWNSAEAELWIAPDTGGGAPAARRMDSVNGIAGGASYLPVSGAHTRDEARNYQPTVNPIASGGYYWVVFTSRRMYGNVADSDPYGGSPDSKKLWVAAIDINAPAGADPSHPPFYLPGQELASGNSRGFWVVDPCKANGSGCETGDECCNGFCRRPDDGGALVCSDKPKGTTCVDEFERCTRDADCCDVALTCINGRCSKAGPK